MKRWLWVLVALIALLAAGTAFAHERVVSGNYAFVLGWLDEPPIVGLKNAAVLEVTTAKDNKPVEDASSLTAQIVYGGQSKDLMLRPLEGQPGVFAGDFIPTQRGTYTLKVGGTINGQAIDASADIEEVEAPDSFMFPAPQADLQKSIAALQSELGTTRAFAVAGAALGAIGLVLAGVALRKR